ncbi:hypothetical protein BY996DRAFT_6454619 [Phakopsora pachyrhizi]|nr:hypothetical protein BY996DRAFT_6454619 [Phakopsora pachyrhizi]
MKIKSLQIGEDNINKFTLNFYNCVSKLRILELAVDEKNLAYSILTKIPESLGVVWDSIITSGSTSNNPLFSKVILNLLDSYIKTNCKYTDKVQKELDQDKDQNTAAVLFNQICPKSSHNPKAKHPASNCFSLHPKLLKGCRNGIEKQLNRAKAHSTNILPEQPKAYLASANLFEGYQGKAL